MRCFLVFTCLIAAGCTGIPGNVTPVDNFDIQRYLGTWYEIARMDHSFERGLSRVSAEYSLRDDGGVRVINRGFNAEKNRWEQAEGRAYFIGDPSIGRLKVSFFGPFYGAYNIINLDRDHYRYALVCGPDTDYLWILSRTSQLDRDILDQLVSQAASFGFDTSGLIYVEH